MRVLALDPSGNWGEKEGFGTTGYAVIDNGNLFYFGDIEAKMFMSQEGYWSTMWDLFMEFDPEVIVCESFRMRNGNSRAKVGSTLDTPQLIGWLRMSAYMKDIEWVFQDPSAKARFSDEILTETGILEKRGRSYYFQDKMTNDHMRDAIRHGLYFNKYGKKAK
jgi:hypothetical protein